MSDQEVLNRIGEEVDRFISIDITGRGLIRVLYDAARASNSGRPLSLTAAERLAQATTAQQPVIIATGLPLRGWFSPALGETDGHVGAATLARAVFVGLKALPVLICEEEQVPLLRACVRGAGLIPSSFEEIEAARRSPHAVHVSYRPIPAAVVQGFPADEGKADEESHRLLSRKPAAVISIERQGANVKGVYHYGRGEANISEIMAKVDRLFERAQAGGVLTIGIGDGGNEIGMGRIKEAIRKHILFGAKCACPCQAGMAPEFAPDVLVSATASNWGAWGIEACLAAITGDLRVLHSPEMELNVLRACIDAGGLDGVTGFGEPRVDGLPGTLCASMLEILHTIVREGLKPDPLFQYSEPR